MPTPDKHFPLVVVTWWDAEDARDSWIEIADAQTFATVPCAITSVGYLVRRTRDYTVLCADLAVNSSGHRSVGRVTKIPTAWIRGVRRLPRG